VQNDYCDTFSDASTYFTSARKRVLEAEGLVKTYFHPSVGIRIFPKSNIPKEGRRHRTYKSFSTVLLVVFCAVRNVPSRDRRQSSFSHLGWHWDPSFFSYFPSLPISFFFLFFFLLLSLFQYDKGKTELYTLEDSKKFLKSFRRYCHVHFDLNWLNDVTCKMKTWRDQIQDETDVWKTRREVDQQTNILQSLTMSRNFPHFMEPKFHYRVHKSPSLIPILNQTYPVHNFPPFSPKIYFNIILPFTPRSSE
jgi:hypothetical protein